MAHAPLTADPLTVLGGAAWAMSLLLLAGDERLVTASDSPLARYLLPYNSAPLARLGSERAKKSSRVSPWDLTLYSNQLSGTECEARPTIIKTSSETMVAILESTSSASARPNLWTQAAASLDANAHLDFDLSQSDQNNIIQDIVISVQRRQNECLRKGWKYKNEKGEIIVLQDVFLKIITWVKQFIHVGVTIAQYDPAYAALPWAGVRSLLQISVDDPQTLGAIAEGVELVSNLIARGAALEMLYLQRTSAAETELSRILVKLYSTFLVYLSKAGKSYEQAYLGKSIAIHVISVDDPSPWPARRHTVDTLADRTTTGSDILNATQSQGEGFGEYFQQILDEQKNLDACLHTVTAELMNDTQNNMQMAKTEELVQIRLDQDGWTEQQALLKSIIRNLESPIVRTATRLQDLNDHLKGRVSDFYSRRTSADSRERVRPGADIQMAFRCGIPRSSCFQGKDAPSRLFQEWRKSSVSSILWLHGIPGSGKSMLCASVVQRLSQESKSIPDPAPVAHFYCVRNSAEPERAMPVEILNCILAQLATLSVDLPIREPVVRRYMIRRASSESKKPSRLDLDEAVEAILELLSQHPATIVIDALDECNPQTRHELFYAFNRFIQESPTLVKIFISSRDDHDIVHRLSKVPSLYINTSDNSSDIENYVRSQVAKAISEERLLCGEVSQDLEEHIVQTLISKAQGMFRLPSLHIETLCDPYQVKTEDNARHVLGKLPKKLNESYQLIFEQINMGEYPNPEIASRIMNWLMCALRKMDTAEFVAAISVDSSGQCFNLKAADVLSICCNLVVLDQEQNTFRFAHLSVREYLESLEDYSSLRTHSLALERSLLTCFNLMELQQSTTILACDMILMRYVRLYGHRHFEALSKHGEKIVIEKGLKDKLGSGYYSSPATEAYCNWSQRKYDIDIWCNSSEDPIDRYIQTVLEEAFLIFDYALPRLVRKDDGNIIRAMLARHANINQRDGTRKTVLSYALKFQNDSLVRELLQYGAMPTVFERDPKGLVDLHRTVQAEYHFGVQLLLNHGAFADVRDNVARTPLIIAAESGFHDIMKTLLEHGADVSLSDYTNRNVIHVSAGRGDTNCVQLLLKYGAPIMIRDYYQSNPLHLAAAGGHESLVSLLLENGASLTATNHHGETPLHVATLQGHAGAVSILLAAELDPEKRQRDAMASLHWGIDAGQLAVVKQLLEPEASRAEFQRSIYDSILGIAPSIDQGNFVKVIDFLLDCWTDINTGNHRGQTLLHQAAKLGNLQLAQILLTRHASMTIEANDGETAFLTACGQKSQPIVELFLRAEADPNSMQPDNRYTALHKAAEGGDVEIVKLLVERGADVNAELPGGLTALHLASEKGHEDIVELLFDLM
ncbi:hypothetical protein BP5796_08230 [Coleophoma crateriformis]|uniref:Uncharacterized protein n=1 Tax=Coleophoma crateriformis TaxID=565419 RepID=A0A3D8RE31_9HELO|nr:hypothetical protein BP5796_08230 [Coleophoma crateriformis]